MNITLLPKERREIMAEAPSLIQAAIQKGLIKPAPKGGMTYERLRDIKARHSRLQRLGKEAPCVEHQSGNTGFCMRCGTKLDSIHEPRKAERAIS